MIADIASTWSPGTLYIAVQPYILSAFGAIVASLIAWGVAILQKHSSITLDAATRDKVQTAALNAAGRILASQDAKFADMKIDVHSAFIVDEIPVVMGLVGDAVAKLGLTPDKLASIIQAKVGILQAQAQGSAKAVTT